MLLLQKGIQLFNDRQYFACHEILEEEWTSARGPRRLFLQSLIHLAVGLYHWERGNPTGATLQLRKGLAKLSACQPAFEGIDTARLIRDATHTLQLVEAGAPQLDHLMIHVSLPIS